MAILVGPDNLVGQIEVEALTGGHPGVAVVERADRSRADLSRRFIVKTDPNLEPGPRTIEFRGSAGRQELRTVVSVVIQSPRIVPLPPAWKRAKKDRELFRIGEKVYPKRIERELPADTCVAAVLISGAKSRSMPFYIMEDKVWVALFERFADETLDPDKSAPWRDETDPRCPVRNVTAAQAQKFAEWLGGKGQGFLPTFDQWNEAAGMSENDNQIATWSVRAALGSERETARDRGGKARRSTSSRPGHSRSKPVWLPRHVREWAGVDPVRLSRRPDRAVTRGAVQSRVAGDVRKLQTR